MVCVSLKGGTQPGNTKNPENQKHASPKRSGTTTGGAEPRGDNATMSLRDRFVASRAATPTPARAMNRLVSASQARGLAAESATFEFLVFAAAEQASVLTSQAKNQETALNIATQDFDLTFDLVSSVKETFSSHVGDGTFDTTTVFNTVLESLSDVDRELADRRATYTFAGSLRVSRTILQSLLSALQGAQQRFAAEQRDAAPAPATAGGWGRVTPPTDALPDTFDEPEAKPSGRPKRKPSISALD